tara:strand:- start:642 stop:1229 length:588 start_codon:yes stop_codon:yes gene_type:complete
MPVTINGDGSITGLSVGGLGSGVVNDATLASNAVTSAKLASGAITSTMLPAGTIVQVVNVYYDNHQSISGTGETDHGFTATITPKVSGNKIWVSMSGVVGSAYTDNFARGLFKLDVAGAGYNTIGAHFFLGGRKTASRDTETWTHDYLHTTSSASVHNFKLYTRVIDGNSMNIGGWSHDANWKHRTTCTLMEIAA